MRKILLVLFVLFFVNINCFAMVDLDGNAANNENLDCGTNDFVKDDGAWSFYWRGTIDTQGTGSAGRWFNRPDNLGFTGISLALANTAAVSLVVGELTTNMTVTTNNSCVVLASNGVLIVTYDGSGTAANQHIYWNGTECTYATQTDGIGGLSDNSTAHLYLGNRNTTANVLDREFDGPWGEHAFWGRVINAQEIAQLSKSSVRRAPLQMTTSLNEYMDFDQGADTASANGATFVDMSQAGNNCTGSAAGLTWKAETNLSYP